MSARAQGDSGGSGCEVGVCVESVLEFVYVTHANVCVSEGGRVHTHVYKPQWIWMKRRSNYIP